MKRSNSKALRLAPQTSPYYNDNTLILVDGQFVHAKDASGDLFSQTLHYGLGAFEGIRSYKTTEGTKIFKAKEHFERLAHSAHMVHLPLPYTVEEMTEMSYELLERNHLTDAYIRPLVFAEPNMGLMPCQKTHLMIAAWKWDLLYGNKLADLKISSYQRPNPKSVHMEAKICGHYVNSILATQEAKSQGYNDAVMLDMNGFVAEASGANLFYEKNEILYTPEKGHILPGITRNTVIDLARSLGMLVVEKQIMVKELLNADGVFLAGTAAEVTGVRTIDDKPMVMAWEDTLGFVLSRKYKQMVTRVDQTQGTLI